jgi:hypothetical protein
MPMFLSFVVMNEERFILAWDTPFPDAAFKLTIYRLTSANYQIAERSVF